VTPKKQMVLHLGNQKKTNGVEVILKTIVKLDVSQMYTEQKVILK
jgi:hypothetical protein